MNGFDSVGFPQPDQLPGYAQSLADGKGLAAAPRLPGAATAGALGLVSPTPWDDEFNDAAGHSGPNNGLAPRWNLHSTLLSYCTLDDSVAPGCLYLDIPTAQAVGQHLYQAAPPGDFVVCIQISSFLIGTTNQVWGLSVLDSSGAGRGVCFQVDTAFPSAMYALSAWAQSGGSIANFANIGGSNPSYAWMRNMPMTMWLRKAGTTFTGCMGWSPRKRTMPPAAPGLGQALPSATSSFTAAYIAFGRIQGSGSARVEIDSFRVQAN